MTARQETAAMRRAISAAWGAGRTSPNPRVGCVLLDAAGDEIAGGVHHGAGAPHAEVEALTAAGGRARGATAVVTLEPCRHTGRTGPCVQALIDAGVARVVIGQRDPTPDAGGGAEILRAAGIDVETDVLAEEAAELTVEWTHAVTTGRPFVTWKFAATLDGHSAASDGTSRWITGAEARRDVHTLRAGCDAIVVGTQTVLTDDPRLTVRDADDRPIERARQPLRVVVGHRPVPEEAAVRSGDADTLLLATHDPAEVLQALASRHVRHVWLEGGPTLAAAFWSAGLVDRVVGYLAPAFLGAGRSALDGAPTTIGDLRRMTVRDLRVVGRDIRIVASPVAAGEES